jgi:peptidyl-prolyl cis-trans isomerase C
MRIKQGKRYLGLLTALILCAIAWPGLAKESRALEDKVAMVNGAAITRQDFNREMSMVQRQMVSKGKVLKDFELAEIQKKVLESLIDEELLYQEGSRRGIKIDEKAIDDSIADLKKRFSGEETFQNALKRANIDEATLKARVEKGMIVRKFIDQEFTAKTRVSEKEIRDYYETHPDLFQMPEQVRASHILLKVDAGAGEGDRAEARIKMTDIRKRLEKGEDFAALATEFSQCPSAQKGGDLGYFRRGQMVKPFAAAAFALNPGEISEVVETQFGYHLIKLTDKKPETTIGYEESKEKLNRFLMGAKVREETGSYVKNLKQEAKVERYLSNGSK